jgi:alpha-D-ribose 1-methylphosphonate 5-triphosphate diphosphatase PhnM
MKFYHNEFGYAQFEPCRDKLVKLALALDDRTFKTSSEERGFVLDAFCSLRQDFEVSKSLGETGLGGSLNVEQWKERVEKCSVEQALKSIFIDFLALDYMPVEFLNVAWDSTCEIQICRLIS